MALVAQVEGPVAEARPRRADRRAGPRLHPVLRQFQRVYLAERYITSGVVATVFALLLIPNSLLAWAFLGQKPSRRFLWAALVAVAGIGAAVRPRTSRAARGATRDIAIGLGLTLVGMLGASAANVYQAGKEARRHPLFGAARLVDGDRRAASTRCIAFAVAGPPVVRSAARLLARACSISRLPPRCCASASISRWCARSGRARRPIRACWCRSSPWAFRPRSKAIAGPRWPIAGAVLALGGMLLALAGRRRPTLVTAPDAA